MSYKIAIASGKGGTGKTTVSVNLYHFFNKMKSGIASLVDCDVEEPNDTIFFPNAIKNEEQEIFQLIPEIDKVKCTYCRKCVEYCEFNAIVVIPPIRFAEVNASLCHSCGACIVACRDNAITEKQEPIGAISFFNVRKDEKLIEGRLKIGSAMQTMLIKELKKHVSEDNEITLFDAPPGTSCPVVETISDTDYVILVSEPTLFGLHDLKLMVELMEEIKKPFGVVINKAGLGDSSIYDYLNQNKIEILGEIPFSKEYAASYANGNLFDKVPTKIANSYEHIIESLEQKIFINEGNNYFKW
jgi:MinD superfamily P-loop ATPase